MTTAGDRLYQRLIEHTKAHGQSWDGYHNFLEGIPGFVVGNGWSRTYYPIEQLRDWGLVGVCNSLGLQYPKPLLHAFIDGNLAERYAFRIDLMPTAMVLCPWGNRQYFTAPFPRRIVFWKERTSSRSLRPPYHDLTMTGCVGNYLFQATHWFGCNPIYLVGMDGCYELDPSTRRMRGNTYRDALARSTVMWFRGKETRKNLKDWAMALEGMYQEIQNSGHRREIYRLGDHGIMTEIPHRSWKEVKERHAPKEDK